LTPLLSLTDITKLASLSKHAGALGHVSTHLLGYFSEVSL
jgi:hypothetical protein